MMRKLWKFAKRVLIQSIQMAVSGTDKTQIDVRAVVAERFPCNYTGQSMLRHDLGLEFYTPWVLSARSVSPLTDAQTAVGRDRAE